MFQFHLVDTHGLTRPGAAATQLAVDSHDPGPDDETPSKGHSSRKRKKAGDANLLEWMPHSTFPDIKDAQADFSPVRPSKRSRQDKLTVCPAILSLDSTGNEQSNHGGDGPFICSPSPFGQKKRDVSVEAAMIEPISPNENAAVDTVETANSEDSSGFDSLFDLYLRTPSASPVPFSKGEEPSVTIPAITEQIVLSSDEEISGDFDRGGAGTYGEQAPTNGVIVPRIRLRVRQPAITLNIKVPKQDEQGKKPSSKRLRGVGNKQRTGKNRANRRTKQRQGKKNVA